MSKEQSATMTKEQYIEEIIELLRNCDNIDNIDLVYRILAKTA